MTTQMLKAHDVGSGEYSTVLTKAMQDRLVPWLPKSGFYQSSGVSGSNVSYLAHYQEFGDRGYPGGINLITAGHADSSYNQGDAAIIVPVAGRRIGLMTFTVPAGTAKFDAFVDGRCVLSADAASRTTKYDETATHQGPNYWVQQWALADDLLWDGPHNVEIILRTPPAGFSSLVVNGFLVEERMGYRPIQAVDHVGVPATLTTAYAAMPFSTTSSGTSVVSIARGVVGWTYVNTDTITHTILVQVAYSGQGPFAYKNIVVPAASGTVPGTAFLAAGNGRPVGVDSNWTHKLNEATSTGAVTCFPEMAL